MFELSPSGGPICSLKESIQMEGNAQSRGNIAGGSGMASRLEQAPDINTSRLHKTNFRLEYCLKSWCSVGLALQDLVSLHTVSQKYSYFV
jgi:hypothetical protein